MKGPKYANDPQCSLNVKMQLWWLHLFYGTTSVQQPVLESILKIGEKMFRELSENNGLDAFLILVDSVSVVFYKSFFFNSIFALLHFLMLAIRLLVCHYSIQKHGNKGYFQMSYFFDGWDEVFHYCSIVLGWDTKLWPWLIQYSKSWFVSYILFYIFCWRSLICLVFPGYKAINQNLLSQQLGLHISHNVVCLVFAECTMWIQVLFVNHDLWLRVLYDPSQLKFSP